MIAGFFISVRHYFFYLNFNIVLFQFDSFNLFFRKTEVGRGK